MNENILEEEIDKIVKSRVGEKAIAICNLLLYIVMITINALANILPINDRNTGELSDLYPNLFVPAGLTFSIWGVIYLLLLLYVINQVFKSFKPLTYTNLKIKDNIIFGFTCILNFLWILAWHYELVFLSVIIMVLLLINLTILFINIDKIKFENIFDKIAVKISISVYLGWITVATIANITALLVSWKWNGFGLSENVWTIIMIATATLINLFMLIYRRNIAFNLVFIWALVGIFEKRTSESILNLQNIDNGIIYTCYAALVIVSLFIIFDIFKHLKAKNI